jgi:hypothetical protein
MIAPLLAASLALIGVAGLAMLLLRLGIVRYNRYDRRERGRLRAGDPAPDLELGLVDGTPLRLSELWRERPVFLVFGSCT